MYSLDEKFAKIKYNIMNDIYSDQELMKMVYYAKDAPLQEEDIRVADVKECGIFKEFKAWYSQDKDGETYISKMRTMLMFEFSMKHAGTDMMLVTIKPTVLTYGDLLEVETDKEHYFMDRIDFIFNKVNEIILSDIKDDEGNVHKALSKTGIGDPICLDEREITNLPFELIGRYKEYQNIIYADNRSKYVRIQKQQVK